MKIEFVGGAGTVTGSSYIIKDDDFTFMVDCGMFQGRLELRNRNAMPLIHTPSKIDGLLLTHAHIDHSGLIPKLVKKGFYGNIYATKATTDLCTIMLPDSAHIQEMDTRYINKKNRKLNRPEVNPLYTVEDAEKSLDNFVPVAYGEKIRIHPRIEVRFRDAGHILGSAIIEMWVDEGSTQTKLVFTGDLGPGGQAIIRDPEIIEDADFLLIESTYGNRLHKSKEDTYNEFKNIILNSHNNNGNIIIPAFAIERTQEIVYTLAELFRNGEIPEIPVYIDSPLAISATEIFRKNEDCFDKETKSILLSGDSPLDFPHLKFTKSTEESKQLNETARGSIIISASGMCTAGRIKYHLANNLYNPNSSVIFVGYQAEGTLGRRIVEGADQVKLYGEDVAVNANIATLGGFSAHADQKGIIKWLNNLTNKKCKIFVIHGEEESSEVLGDILRNDHGFHTHVPQWGEIYDLTTMASEFAAYSPVDTFSALEKEIDALSNTIELLKQHYIAAREEEKIADAQQFKEDLQDARELLAMIIDEL